MHIAHGHSALTFCAYIILLIFIVTEHLINVDGYRKYIDA